MTFFAPAKHLDAKPFVRRNKYPYSIKLFKDYEGIIKMD